LAYDTPLLFHCRPRPSSASLDFVKTEGLLSLALGKKRVVEHDRSLAERHIESLEVKQVSRHPELHSTIHPKLRI
jgi:hypothetical protein